MELTPRQADVLLVIRNYKHLHGHSPTFTEIAASLKIARATTVTHVSALIKKGMLRHTPNKARTLEVVADNQGPETPAGAVVKRKRKNTLGKPTTDGKM